MSISDTTVADDGGTGIRFSDDNSDLSISNTAVTRTTFDGISFSVNKSNATIANTIVTDAGGSGISFTRDNSNMSIAATTITDAINGIFIGLNNSIALNDSTLAGTFQADGIHIANAGNTLSGGNNTAAGATFGAGGAGQFCEVTGAQTGSFAFVDDGTGNPATCPPP